MTFPTASFRNTTFICLGLILGGCETLEDRVRTTREVPVVTQEFDASASAVMAAVPGALSEMGYSITSTSAAHGEVEAISDVRRDFGIRNSRQTRLKFTVEDRDGGYAFATLKAWEIREEENSRGERLMSEVGVAGPTFHNSVFSAIQGLIAQPAK